MSDAIDVLVIGAGPVGLACAIEAKREGLRPLVIDKGALVNSIVGYPARMEFFSTPELIEIGGHPFPIQGYKPTREEAVEYLPHRRGAGKNRHSSLRAGRPREWTFRRLHHRDRQDGAPRPPRGRLIGFFDLPNPLHVRGEDLPKVTHYYREPYPYVRQKVAVIGARNSAAKAALDCYRHGASVTLIVRSPSLSDKIKYWIKPDLENRIAEGSIRAFFSTTIEEIRESSIALRTPDGAVEIENDWVLAMTGYHPDYGFLEALEIEIAR